MALLEKNLPPQIFQCSWKEKRVSQRNLLIKGVFADQSRGYSVLVYDEEKILLQCVDATSFAELCQDQNPNVEATGAYQLEQVEKCFYTSCEHECCYEVTPSGALLTCKIKIEGNIPFVWRFSLSRGSNGLLNRLLVVPLFKVAQEYDREQQLLFSLLTRKDDEINDFKAQGVSVSRKSLQTAVFASSSFVSTCRNEMIDRASTSIDVSGFFSEKHCQELFESCLAATPFNETNLLQEERTDDDVDATVLLGDSLEPTVAVIPTATVVEPLPVVPGLKRSHEGDKETNNELRRRMELEYKLAKKAETKSKQKNTKLKL